MQSLSTWISLESLNQILFKKPQENVYSHRFWDIAVQRQVGIMTGTAVYSE